MYCFIKNYTCIFICKVYYIINFTFYSSEGHGGMIIMSNDTKQIKHINIAIPVEMHTEAKINATKQGLTLGDYVRRALEMQLKKDSDN